MNNANKIESKYDQAFAKSNLNDDEKNNGFLTFVLYRKTKLIENKFWHSVYVIHWTPVLWVPFLTFIIK
jgi:hypothetical protein